MSKTLFGDKIVQSVSYDQSEILEGIIQLYLPEGIIQVDPCYNAGTFYKKIPQPQFKLDIKPLSDDVEKCDCRKLPFATGTIKSLIFDPPFVSGTHVESEIYLMSKKYGSFKNHAEHQLFLKESIAEFSRVLKNRGIFIVKIMDQVSGRKNCFNSLLVIDEAKKNNFQLKDIFILIARNRFIGNVQKQHHARKFHCYFLVFKKHL